MAILSDSRILEKVYSKSLQIEPLLVENIQPSSIDLTLGDTIEVPKQGLCISPSCTNIAEMRDFFETVPLNSDFVLSPGEFVLAQVGETISLSSEMVGNIQNRNSLIRCGINVGLSSYINPGYKGKLPIAIHNVGKFDFKLTPGMRICQLVIAETHGVNKDYSDREEAKYHEEETITLSKISEDKEFKEYIKKYGKINDSAHLANFLRERIEEKSKDFFEQLTLEQKKQLGLV